MARSRRTSSSGRSGGSTLFGILVGLIVGVAAAVGVTLYVTKAPMPFADKASRDPAKVLLPPDARDAPDPNLGLLGKGNGAGTPSAPIDTTIRPDTLSGASTPAGKPPGTSTDTLGQLIATLEPAAPGTGAAQGTGTVQGKAPAPSAPAQGGETRPGSGNTVSTPRVPSPTAPAVPGTEPARPAAPASQTTYYLQAGAFRSEADAQAMLARIVLLGMPVSIEKAQVNGENVNRVRVGPFKRLDDMNRSRARLGQENITTSVVRP